MDTKLDNLAGSFCSLGNLAAPVRAFDADPAAARGGVRMALNQWRSEPDLLCVRDPGELDKLAADERREYLALWPRWPLPSPALRSNSPICLDHFCRTWREVVGH